MSSVQSTGSHTNPTVNQQSADHANSTFDALIDLLASDDIHDNAGADSHPSHSPRPNHTLQLRDSSGKLDFDKIRLMFATQNLGADRIDNKALDDIHSETHSLRAQRGSHVQDALSRIGLSRSVSPSSQSTEPQRQQGSRLASAGSSAPLDQNVQSASTQTQQSTSSARASHFSSDELARLRTDEEKYLSRYELPNAQIAVPCDKTLLPHHGSPKEKGAARPTEPTAPLTVPSPLHVDRVGDLAKPLEFEQLTSALSHATSEIDTLREQYEKLRTSVAERFSPQNSLQTRKPSVQTSGNHVIPSSQPQPSDIQDPGILGEISSLSEYEAKNILTGLITTLHLSPRSVMNLVSKFLDEGPVCPQPNSVDDIRSSMEFLARVDELVWKRSVLVNGSGPDLLYSRANTDALIERLALWEKAIRGHHKG